MDFLALLRSGGRLCGWLEKALWEYCISKDYFEESKSLSLSLLHFDFALCTCLCPSLNYLIFLKSVQGKGCVCAAPCTRVFDSCLALYMNCSKVIGETYKSYIFINLFQFLMLL